MKLKNNTDRKTWLRNYQDWGLWYEDDHIGAKYYHYIFDNEAELIVAEYVIPENKYMPEHVRPIYHLIGGPKETHGKWLYHPKFSPFGDSGTYLVEFLKSLGKNVDLC